MLLRRHGSVTHETSNQSRRDAKNAHSILLDERPQTIRSGKIQRPLVTHHRRAEKSFAKRLPRAHHPPHVRHPVKNVLLPHIKAEHHVLSSFDRKTTVGVNGPFGPTGRS